MGVLRINHIPALGARPKKKGRAANQHPDSSMFTQPPPSITVELEGAEVAGEPDTGCVLWVDMHWGSYRGWMNGGGEKAGNGDKFKVGGGVGGGGSDDG